RSAARAIARTRTVQRAGTLQSRVDRGVARRNARCRQPFRGCAASGSRQQRDCAGAQRGKGTTLGCNRKVRPSRAVTMCGQEVRTTGAGARCSNKVRGAKVRHVGRWKLGVGSWLALVAAISAVSGQSIARPALTLEWINSDAGRALTRLPSYAWLKDGTA